jgi:hypothetical protein
VNPSEPSSAPHRRRRQRRIKLTLFLISLAFSAAALIAFDYFYSAANRGNPQASVDPHVCRIPDPVRHHALKPNCTSTEEFGGSSYEFSTNSLGFRDERIREIPLTEARPRVLVLGDSFTEGMLPWRNSYVGRIAAHFPQYDFLNGGLALYSPSNDLNTARMVLAKGVDIDEVLVFIGPGELQFDAAFYQDANATGTVAERKERSSITPWYAAWRFRLARHFRLISDFAGFLDRFLVEHGYYYLPMETGNRFDAEESAWTYRKVDETDAFPAGYSPLGLDGGIAKEEAKMTLLWQELKRQNIPLSVVVYPYPAQLVHDTTDSRHVRMWRQWCEGKCKRFISVFPVFFAAKEECPRSQPGCWYLDLFTFGDKHYSPAGNAMVADVVIQSLEGDPPRKHSELYSQPKSGPGLGAH